MPGLVEANRFLSLYFNSFRFIFRIRAWAYLLAYSLLAWMLLYVLYDLSNPVFHSFATWWVAVLDSLFGTEDSLLFFRFPDHLKLLGDKFGWARFATGLVVESLVLGATARILAGMMRANSDDTSSRKPLLTIWIHLALAWLLVNLATVLIGNLVPELFPFLTRTPKRLLLLQVIVLPGSFALLFSLFVFTLPLIAIRGDSILTAISGSLRIFWDHPFTCIAMAGSILALPMIFSILSGYSSLLMDRFRPELIYWLLVGGLFADMIANYFWMAVTVQFLKDE